MLSLSIFFCFQRTYSAVYHTVFFRDNVWAGNLLFPPSGIAQSLPYHFSTPVAQGRYVLQQHTGSPNQLLHQQQNAADYSPFAPVTSSTVITTTTGASGTRLADGAVRPTENTTGGGSSKNHSGTAHANHQTTGNAPSWLWTYFFANVGIGSIPTN